MQVGGGGDRGSVSSGFPPGTSRKRPGPRQAASKASQHQGPRTPAPSRQGRPQEAVGRAPLTPALAKDILRYFSLLGVPSLAPAVAMAKAEAADRLLRLLSSSRQDVLTTPLL